MGGIPEFDLFHDICKLVWREPCCITLLKKLITFHYNIDVNIMIITIILYWRWKKCAGLGVLRAVQIVICYNNTIIRLTVTL